MKSKNKICTMCKKEKSISEFGTDNNRPDKLKQQCRDCRNKKSRISRKNIKLYFPEKYKEQKEKDKANKKKWAKENQDKVKASRKKYEVNNKAKVHFSDRISKSLYRMIERFGTKTETKKYPLLKYSPRDLKEHIESQFRDGMTWENRGEHWVIDNIWPRSEFLQDAPLYAVNCLSNLQPLLKHENGEKADNPPKIFYSKDLFIFEFVEETSKIHKLFMARKETEKNGIKAEYQEYSQKEIDESGENPLLEMLKKFPTTFKKREIRPYKRKNKSKT